MRIKLKNIHKSFGLIHANNGVTLEIEPGIILGLLGENGAGKSTLMKILSGMIEMDSGEFLVDGRNVAIKNPADALRIGIGMLHQDPHDFPSMSIKENLQVNAARAERNPDMNWARLLEYMNKLVFRIDLEGRVDDLTVGERQQLELLRLLWQGADLLILDEPTTGISANQKELLFSALKTIASEGKAVIFVSHKLEEIQSLCGRAAVMRKGELVGELKAPFNQDEMVRLMFGRNVKRVNPCRSLSDELCMEIKDLLIDDFRLRIESVNLRLKKGEVIGLAGMEGSGQRQLLRVLAGLLPSVSGDIRIDSKSITARSCFHFQKDGIYYVPSARIEEGLMSGMTLSEHFYLSNPQSKYIVNKRANLSYTEERIHHFKIKGRPVSLVEELSGGNQQRMLLALLEENASLLLLENPMRGLDVESANWIWTILRRRCEDGTAIIFSSADLDELLFYSDRIMIFFAGRVSPAIPASTLDESKLGTMIGGTGWDDL